MITEQQHEDWLEEIEATIDGKGTMADIDDEHGDVDTDASDEECSTGW